MGVDRKGMVAYRTSHANNQPEGRFRTFLETVAVTGPKRLKTPNSTLPSSPHQIPLSHVSAAISSFPSLSFLPFLLPKFPINPLLYFCKNVRYSSIFSGLRYSLNPLIYSRIRLLTLLLYSRDHRIPLPPVSAAADALSLLFPDAQPFPFSFRCSSGSTISFREPAAHDPDGSCRPSPLLSRRSRHSGIVHKTLVGILPNTPLLHFTVFGKTSLDFFLNTYTQHFGIG